MNLCHHSNSFSGLNNEAVRQLRRGNDNEATTLFGAALRHCQSLLPDCPSRHSESYHCFLVDQSIQDHIDSRGSPCADGYSYFYNEPISLPSWVQGHDLVTPSAEDMSSICAVITFNIGICLYNTSDGKEDVIKTKLLRKSLAFFEKACQMCGVVAGLYDVPSPVFAMALLNNKGVILRQLGLKETSQKLFDELMVFGLYRGISGPSMLRQSSRKSCSLLLEGLLGNALQDQSSAAGAA